MGRTSLLNVGCAAFNAAPGTIAPEQDGPYGAYAQALAEMMREGGLSLGDLFDRVRLRVNDMTKGAQVPWNSSRVEAPFVFFERSPDARFVRVIRVRLLALVGIDKLGAVHDLAVEEREIMLGRIGRRALVDRRHAVKVAGHRRRRRAVDFAPHHQRDAGVRATTPETRSRT